MVRNPVSEVIVIDNNEPTSYGEAMVGLNFDEWLEAIKSKKGSMTLEEILMVVRPLGTDGF